MACCMLVDTASLRTWLWSISRTNKSPEGLWVGGVLQLSQLTAASDAHYQTLSGKSPSNSAIRAKWSSSRSHSCKAQVTTLRQWKIVKTNKKLRVWIMPKGLSLMMPYGVARAPFSAWVPDITLFFLRIKKKICRGELKEHARSTPNLTSTSCHILQLDFHLHAARLPWPFIPF